MQPFLKAPEGVAIEYYDGTEEIDPPLVWSHFNETEQLHVWEVLNPHPDRSVKAMTVEVLPPHTSVTLIRVGGPR
jgi:hypothetical protein